MATLNEAGYLVESERSFESVWLSDPMRCAVVVTGASRGFGRCLALDFARELATSDLDLFLWARDEVGLNETSQQVHEARRSVPSSGRLRVFTRPVDLSDSADYTAKVDALLIQLTSGAERHDRVFLVHNAGALGGLGFAQECPSPSVMARHFELNVTSVMWLNKRFLDVFGREVTTSSINAIRSELTVSQADGLTPRLVILNVSSRSAIAPYPTLSQYCTAKAAREMHFRVLALEQSGCHCNGNCNKEEVAVLSYSPGAMDTDMQKTMRESPLMAPQLAKWFNDMKQGTLVPTEKSSRRGVVAAIRGAFESGKYVTFDELSFVDEP